MHSKKKCIHNMQKCGKREVKEIFLSARWIHWENCLFVRMHVLYPTSFKQMHDSTDSQLHTTRSQFYWTDWARVWKLYISLFCCVWVEVCMYTYIFFLSNVCGNKCVICFNRHVFNTNSLFFFSARVVLTNSNTHSSPRYWL